MSISDIDSLFDSPFEGASLFDRSMKNWLPSSGSADAEILPSIPILRARSRHAYNNIDIAGAPIDRVVDNAIGFGLTPQITLKRKKLGYPDELADSIEQDIEDRFNEWAKKCDFDRHLTFGGLQALSLRSMFASGDVFINTVVYETLLIQIIEADQVTNPNFIPDTDKYRGGVELDETQRPIAYHILDRHPGEIYTSWKWNRVPIFGTNTNLQRIFFMFFKKRPGSHRGIPFLTNALKTYRILDKYSKSELTAAYIASCFTTFIKKMTGMSGEINTETGKRELTVEPGLILELEPNEEPIFANPPRPNSSFDSFFRVMLQKMGAGLGLPIEFILQSYNASYSASKAAMEQAWKTILIYRELVVNKFCDPLFELWLKYAEIPPEIISCIKVKWVGPAKGTLDSYKETLAAEKRIQLGLSSRAEECEEMRGVDWLDVERQLAKEERQRQLDGLPAMVQTPPIEEFLKDDDNDPATEQPNSK